MGPEGPLAPCNQAMWSNIASTMTCEQIKYLHEQAKHH